MVGGKIMDNVVLKGLVEQVFNESYFKVLDFGVEALGHTCLEYRMDGLNVCLDYNLVVGYKGFTSTKKVVIEEPTEDKVKGLLQQINEEYQEVNHKKIEFHNNLYSKGLVSGLDSFYLRFDGKEILHYGYRDSYVDVYSSVNSWSMYSKVRELLQFDDIEVVWDLANRIEQRAFNYDKFDELVAYVEDIRDLYTKLYSMVKRMNDFESSLQGLLYKVSSDVSESISKGIGNYLGKEDVSL